MNEDKRIDKLLVGISLLTVFFTVGCLYFAPEASLKGSLSSKVCTTSNIQLLLFHMHFNFRVSQNEITQGCTPVSDRLRPFFRCL